MELVENKLRIILRAQYFCSYNKHIPSDSNITNYNFFLLRLLNALSPGKKKGGRGGYATEIMKSNILKNKNEKTQKWVRP